MIRTPEELIEALWATIELISHDLAYLKGATGNLVCKPATWTKFGDELVYIPTRFVDVRCRDLF